MEEYDLIVIGSGPGGYVAAIRGAQLGLKVLCIEKYPKLGGTCLNVGCIPSKALLHSTEMLSKLKHTGSDNGISIKDLSFDFPKMMERKQKIISNFNMGITGLFRKNKVETLFGVASFKDKNTISVATEGKETLVTGKNIILATGSKPTELPFLPFDEKIVLSSTGALSLTKPPKKLVVIGAGVIGVELGSVFQRLGSEVIFLEFLDQICSPLDQELAKEFQKILESQGLAFSLGSKVTGAETSQDSIQINYEINGEKKHIKADATLVCVGRRPNTAELQLDKVNINPDKRGFIPINDKFQTSTPHIYAIGDIVDGPMLAHKASEEGTACVEIICSQNPKIEYYNIPGVIYTHPEVATTGLSEKEAKEKNIDYIVGKFPFKANSRAKCVDEDIGFIKMLAEKKTGRIIGVHIISQSAGELIHEGVLAIHSKSSAQTIAEMSHAHPTLAEAMKEAALVISKKAIHI